MPIDYSKYPSNWFTEIRPRTMRRAGERRDEAGQITTEGRCEWCGVENHSPLASGSPVVLTIAHLDHDNGNYAVEYERLAALCQACHLRYDAPRHHEKRRLGRDEERGQLQLIGREESMELIRANHYDSGKEE